MSERKIKIFFVGSNAKNLDILLRFMHIDDLPSAKNFVWDEENPDYIIATERIYSSYRHNKIFRKMAYRRLNGTAPLKIFFTTEAVAPDFNIFDYSVSWNWKFSYADRASRIPARIFPRFKNSASENEITFEGAKLLLQKKKRFCNFLYSNSRAHSYRDKFFHALCQYKHVDSLGPYMNNINTLISVGGGGATLNRLAGSRNRD